MTSILIQADIDDAVVIRGTLADEAGAAVEGATVTARSISPSGTEASIGAATDEGEGAYSVTLEPDASGYWAVRMESAAPNNAAAECIVYVRESRFS